MVEDWAFFESKLGPRLRQNLVRYFVWFSPVCSVFFVFLKSKKVCRGAKIFLCRSSGCPKGFSNKIVFFCFCLFVLEKEEEKG